MTYATEQEEEAIEPIERLCKCGNPAPPVSKGHGLMCTPCKSNQQRRMRADRSRADSSIDTLGYLKKPW